MFLVFVFLRPYPNPQIRYFFPDYIAEFILFFHFFHNDMKITAVCFDDLVPVSVYHRLRFQWLHFWILTLLLAQIRQRCLMHQDC